MRKTKIICTIGPASADEPILTRMIQSGMNVARLNFSHGDHEGHASVMAAVRKLSAELTSPVAIMQDLQGPKIRIGVLAVPLTLTAMQPVVIGRDFMLDFDISGSVRPGERILIDDGLIELKVVRTEGKLIYCEVVTGGIVQSHKGVNIPDSEITFPVITEKDTTDLAFGLSKSVDMVAVSFVRGAGDIEAIRALIAAQKGEHPEIAVPIVIAKIEKKEAVAHFDDILAVSDGIMVARGDLGVEMPEEEITLLQKMMVTKSIAAGKPVIVATQMLDSMIRNPRPTRAEVSDVSNAVIDGADYVMLSGETAEGKYPVEAVQEMARIIDVVEQSPLDTALAH